MTAGTATLPALNTSIERMTHAGALSVVAAAYGTAALLVAGPWIFTILGIVGLSAVRCEAACGELPVFRSVVIHNALFALVVTSPLAFFFGRITADLLHQGARGRAMFAFAVSLATFAVVVAASAVPFYLWAVVLPAPARAAAIAGAFLIGVSWLVIPFLAAAGAHRAIMLGFAGNAAMLVLLGRLMSEPSAAALLFAFDAAFALTDATLVAAAVRAFGGGTTPDWAYLGRRLRHWELPLAGLAYAVGIWADKVVVWYGASEGVLVVAGVLRTAPNYDTAMFWAQLASIPVIAVAFVHVETRLAALFARFYGRLGQAASLRELTAVRNELRGSVIASVVMLFTALAIVATMSILLSFVFMNALGLRPSYMSILRIALWAMVFHTSAMFCFVFLLYFDLRRQALAITATYAVLNPALTFALLPLGAASYGYGSMLAAAITFVLGFAVLVRELPWLHYHAFITNNTSL